MFQIPGTNALDVANRIKAQMEELKQRFPRDMEYVVSLDTTLPVTEGINEIVHTLFEAVGLVIIVVFVFLQNWRATLIPLMTVPVSLIGAFIFFPMLGFSINVLSLLGLVLAIGIVVDDAIVVVEAVMHHIEHGMEPKEATIKAMEEVSGPVIAIGLILAAVFVPVGFMGGISGLLYQQFAITIALSVLLSVVNALTLSPALAGMLLKPVNPNKKSILQRRSTTGSTRCSAGPRIATSASPASWSARRSAASCSWACCATSSSCWCSASPAASCPRRTRATSWSTRCCPTRRRSSAPTR